eukprot:520103-Rhodomonas_salina.1
MGKGANVSSDTKPKRSWKGKASTFKVFSEQHEKDSDQAEDDRYIANTAWAMHQLYNKRHNEEKAKGVAEAAKFNEDWKDLFDPDMTKARDATLLGELTSAVEERKANRVITRLTVVQSNVVRRTFTTADQKMFLKASQKSEAALVKAMDVAMEDEMLDAQIQFIDPIWIAVFCEQDKKVHAYYGLKEILQSIIQSQAVLDIHGNESPT